VAVVVGALVFASRRKVAPAAPRTPATREWRLVQLTRAVGVVVGLLVGWRVFDRGSYGTGPMLAPAAFGLCVVLATAVGETVVRPRRAAGVRSASLTPRRVTAYLPRVTTALVGVMLVVSTATMVLTTVTASRDDYTDGMRALSCRTATTGSSQTPYPGSYYTLPLGLLLLSVLVVAVLAARQVVRRPRGMAGTEVGDDALRRRSIGVVVAATGIAVCAPYVGVALTAGGALQGLAEQQTRCSSAWMGPVGVALDVAGFAALVVGVWCVVRLLDGSPDRRTAVAEHTGTPVAR
jgi:hypothetical protein